VQADNALPEAEHPVALAVPRPPAAWPAFNRALLSVAQSVGGAGQRTAVTTRLAIWRRRPGGEWHLMIRTTECCTPAAQRIAVTARLATGDGDPAVSNLSTRMAEVSLAVAGQCITATARPASGGGDPAVGDPPAFLLMATGCTTHCALGCMQLIWLPVSMVG